MVMWFLKICLTRFLSLLFITNKSYKGSWAPKNWCFWTAVLKTLESPLDCKEIQPVHPKGDQSWVFIGRTDAEAEAPILWSPDVESWLIGKDPDAWRDWGQEEKVTTEDEMAGWHHLTRWTWVWVDSGSWWWTGKPGVLRFMGLQKVRHDWATELNKSHVFSKCFKIFTACSTPYPYEAVYMHFHFITKIRKQPLCVCVSH